LAVMTLPMVDISIIPTYFRSALPIHIGHTTRSSRLRRT
jgi:hypothetical protein